LDTFLPNGLFLLISQIGVFTRSTIPPPSEKTYRLFLTFSPFTEIESTPLNPVLLVPLLRRISLSTDLCSLLGSAVAERTLNWTNPTPPRLFLIHGFASSDPPKLSELALPFPEGDCVRPPEKWQLLPPSYPLPLGCPCSTGFGFFF